MALKPLPDKHYSRKFLDVNPYVKTAIELNSPLASRLTARKLQIAELVARGLSNAEIEAALWITQNSVKQALKRMFRKLKVCSRTEMIARL